MKNQQHELELMLIEATGQLTNADDQTVKRLRLKHVLEICSELIDVYQK